MGNVLKRQQMDQIEMGQVDPNYSVRESKAINEILQLYSCKLTIL